MERCSALAPFFVETKTLMLSTHSLIADKWEADSVWAPSCLVAVSQSVQCWPGRSLILMHNLITGSRGIQGPNNDIILIDRVIRLQCVYRVRDGRRASHNLTISFNSNNIISAWSKLWWISIWSYDMPILPGMEIFIIKLDRKRINILTTLIPRSAKNRKFKYKNCRIHTEDKDENTQLTGSHGNMPNRR